MAKMIVFNQYVHTISIILKCTKRSKKYKQYLSALHNKNRNLVAYI